MNALDVISATAGVATALGVAFAAFQLRASRQQRQSEFELRFSDRYDDVVARVPLEMLLGEQEYEDVYASSVKDRLAKSSAASGR